MISKVEQNKRCLQFQNLMENSMGNGTILPQKSSLSGCLLSPSLKVSYEAFKSLICYDFSSSENLKKKLYIFIGTFRLWYGHEKYNTLIDLKHEIMLREIWENQITWLGGIFYQIWYDIQDCLSYLYLIVELGRVGTSFLKVRCA